MTMQILLGADPEVFMKRDGKYVNAHNMVQGDKQNPFKVEKGAVQVDGMALEFNIDPASSEDEFVSNLECVMNILKGMVPGYELVADPVAVFGKEYIMAQPPESLILGCDPDFNAWNNGLANPRPDGDTDFRTGAGHVHIGWTQDADVNDPSHLEACIMLTKQLDYYLGLGSLIYDKDTKRRTLYGAAGAFRPKPYGVEYRVLSNAWLKSPKLMRWVYQNTIKAVQDLFEGNAAYNSYNAWAQDAISVEKPDIVSVKYVMKQLGVKQPPRVA